MTLTTFAFIAGLCTLVVYIPMLVSGAKTSAFFLTLTKSDVYMRTAGLVGIILTAVVLRDGASIGTDAEGLIRLVAWLGLIKGILAAWWPSVIVGHCEVLCKNPAARPIWGIAGVCVGVLLLYGAVIV